MSFSLHSSTENFGGGRRSSSSGSNSSSSWSVSVKSLIGLMSRKVSARPFLQEPVERVALDGDEIREFEDLVEVRERIPVPNGGAGRQGRLLEHGVHAGVVAPGRDGTSSKTTGAQRGSTTEAMLEGGRGQQQPNDRCSETRALPGGGIALGERVSRSPTVVKERGG